MSKCIENIFGVNKSIRKGNEEFILYLILYITMLIVPSS